MHNMETVIMVYVVNPRIWRWTLAVSIRFLARSIWTKKQGVT